jgi:hypothetical protein
MRTYGTSGDGGFSFVAIVMLTIFVCYIVSYVWTTQLAIKAAREKGYEDLDGKFWFIGLFGMVFTPAIIAAALPDKKGRSEEAVKRDTENDVAGELPSV